MPIITIALQTLRKIDAMVAADQGAAYRGWLGKVMPHIGDAYRTDEDAHRSHLGASVLGRECGREVWYKFHWATKKNFSGRMLRLFNRGHIEEARFIALLLMIGCEVYQQDANGKQYRISFADGHGGGSGDGVIVNLPDLPAQVAGLGEFKTHGEKSFIELAGKLDEWRKYVDGAGPFTGKGVRDAKFEHYVQMQLYMRKMGLAAALYVAVNKNTDDLYAEVVTLDTVMADQFLARGETLVWAPIPPKKINVSPGFFKCRFCDERPVCHLGAAPDHNCRTCRFSAPVAGGAWACGNPVCAGPIDKARQLAGCSHYEMNKSFHDT
jgi:hypothetical protein